MIENNEQPQQQGSIGNGSFAHLNPTNGLECTFKNITVSLKQGKDKDKVILNSVEGRIEKNRFTAILGSSGSGKTTLITALAHRFEKNLKYEGTIRYDGEKFRKALKKQISFVPQDDIYIGSLTVYEYLYFTAKLKGVDLERVDYLIDRLRLKKCMNSLLGSSTVRGVSGGERKRTCIANELINKPSLLILDECVSGLDSSLSYVVIEVLSELKQELTVLTTIHSPSSTLFEFFDNVIILENGQMFYKGKAKDLKSWLEKIQPLLIPLNYNPCKATSNWNVMRNIYI